MREGIALIFLFLMFSCLNQSMSEKEFVMEFVDGKDTLYFDCFCQATKDVCDGINKCFNGKDLVIIENYKLGKRYGVQKYFYSSGELRSKIIFENGLRNGEMHQFDIDSNLIYYGYYKNDLLIYDKSFEDDGQVSISGLSLKIQKMNSDKNSQLLHGTLEYSMYDEVILGVFIDYGNDGIVEDSMIVDGLEFEYDYSKLYKGEKDIKFLIYEANSADGDRIMGEGSVLYTLSNDQ